jgi:hypothetical protein
VLSQGCRLDAVTSSIQVVFWLLKWCCWCEALHYAEAHFTQVLVRPNILETFLYFCQHADICVWVNCYSSLHHVKENHSFTVPVHCHHHVSGWWRTSRNCAFLTSPSLSLFCPATYSGPIDCSVPINIAEPFMNVSHHFLHCNKELLLQHAVCNNFLW